MILSRTLASFCLVGLTSSLLLPAVAIADDDKNEERIEARISASGKACKNEVAVRYPKSVMAEISIELSETLDEAIDAGKLTLEDISKRGLSFNWQYGQRSGYCNTDGQGSVTQFVTSIEAPPNDDDDDRHDHKDTDDKEDIDSDDQDERT